MTEETKSATHFGEDVFGEEAIRTYLSKDTAKKLQATIREGKPLDPSIAGEVAQSRTASATGRWIAARRTTRTGSSR